MVWLVSHMWMALVLAAVFGFSFGWAIRGLSLKAKARDALVARDVALTELSQSKLEIDQLYAAQSKGIGAATEAGDEVLRAELEAREARLASLGNELASSQAELEALRTRAVSGAGAAAGVDAAQSQERLDTGISQASAAVEWRNRYLESRVRTLETRAQMNTTQTPGTETDTTAVASVAAPHEGKPGEGVQDKTTALSDKAAWQTRYLRQRLAYIETHGFTPRIPVGPTSVEAAELTAPSGATPEAATPDAVPDNAVSTPDSADAGELEQELARLRWRNRYLEGRLAYIDGDAPKSDAELAEEARLASALDENSLGAHSEAETAPPSVATEIDAPDQSDATMSPEAVAAGVASLSASFGRQPEQEDDAREIVDGEVADSVEDFGQVEFGDADSDAPEVSTEPDESLVAEPQLETAGAATTLTDFANTALSETSFASPAETFLATIDSGGSLLKPDMVPIPANGGDDLTRIEGIGGQTSEMLQDLGIWLYSQIADWSPENVAWVNQHFNAEDRVETERWLEQAAELTQSESAGTV